MKQLPLVFLTALVPPAFSASANAAAQDVEQWGIFELVLKGPDDGNPFIDVRFSANFTDGTQAIEVDGFYDGEGVYRVRFMPNKPGQWRYVTQSNRRPLTDKKGVFTVSTAQPGNHGPVRVRNTFHFAYADGAPFKPIGTTLYSWTHRTDAMEALTLKSLAGSPFNKVRMLVFPQAHGIKIMPPPRWPFAGTPPRNWDFTRFNPAFFRHLEERVGQLRELGIEAELILHHPYEDNEGWGFDAMSAETDDRYARYLVARLAAYRNVWWSLANEYDFVRTKTEADWDRTFKLLQAADPYAHLRSIHNGKRLYDHNKPWVTHASIQNGLAASDPASATLYREVYRKPVVYDEIKYEGKHTLRWAQLSGEELVQRFWSSTVAGTYATHGEYLPDAEGNVWIAEGGAPRGQSVARLAFLRKILDDSPAAGLEQIDLWEDTRVAGQPGEYYLIYFGKEAATAWKPALYFPGLADGMAFHVDVIDTWNMTITALDKPMVVKKQDRYYFTAADGQAVKLPARPYMAVRLRRVGASPPPAGAASHQDE